MQEYFKRAYPKWTDENRLFDPSSITAGNINEIHPSRPLNVLMDALRPSRETHLADDHRRPPLATTSAASTSMGAGTVNVSPTKSSGGGVLHNMMFSPPQQPIATVSPGSSPSRSSGLKQSQHGSSQESKRKNASNLVMLAAEEAAARSTLAHQHGPAEQQQQTMLLQSGTQQVDNILLKEYEQQIKRLDSNMNDFMNASSTINMNQLGLGGGGGGEATREADYPRDDFEPKLNQLGMWGSPTTSGKQIVPVGQQHSPQVDTRNG